MRKLFSVILREYVCIRRKVKLPFSCLKQLKGQHTIYHKRLTNERLPIESFHPIEPLAVWFILPVVLLPLLAEEGVADAAAAHRAVLVALRPVAVGRRVRTEEWEVRFGALEKQENVNY